MRPRSRSRRRSLRPSAERLDGVRLGVPEELTGEGIEAGRAQRVQRGARAARRSWAPSVTTVHLPHAPHALSAYYVLAPAEASSNLARFDGVRYGLRADGAEDLLDMYTRTRHDGFGAEVKRRIMLGTYALSSGYYDAYYGRAQRVRTKIAEDFADAFQDVDFLLTPTAPTVAFQLGEKTGDPLAMYLNDYCTVPMSLAGIPAISIPCGLSEGLPVGLQIAGPAFSENRAARRRPCARAGDRLRRDGRSCLSHCEPRPSRRHPLGHRQAAPFRTTSSTSRSSASRSTSSWRPRRRCSAAASSPSASRPTRTPARSASGCPAACRWPTRGRCTSG